jgi:hypothetical protein
MLGLNWSTQVRAMDEHCACCIAVHIDGRRELIAIALAAGVELAMDWGVSEGVGSGPKRIGVGGSRSGFGSR